MMKLKSQHLRLSVVSSEGHDVRDVLLLRTVDHTRLLLPQILMHMDHHTRWIIALLCLTSPHICTSVKCL